MKEITVQLKERSYPIYIGYNLLRQTALLQQPIRAKQIMLVSNETVAKHYLTLMKQAFENYHCDVVLLPDGESYKTLDTLQQIFTALLTHHHHRHTTLVALGGGVIGDMTGFAAACYQRGVDFVQIPTTLLAQVDSSIGGKTAVNHPLGKNMIGAFHQPRAVIIDTATLITLPEREFCAGLAEIIKAALIKDQKFFAWLETNMDKLINKDPAALTEAIYRSCQIKAAIVMADEKEQNGERALLNLGHTFAHAIETNLGYGAWLHGEAVAVGLILAAKLSNLSQEEINRIEKLIAKAKLPTVLPKTLKIDLLLATMQRDKKNLRQQLTFVLLKSMGNATLVTNITTQQVRHVLT